MDRSTLAMDRRLTMKYTREERLEIGRRIYVGEISRYEAADEYGIDEGTGRNYMRMYRDANQLLPKSINRCHGDITKIVTRRATPDMGEYEAMSKEELILELVKARINEARLKKGYEVKGVGAQKEFIPLDNKNTK